ncbi:MAG: MBL fold metallo-hydrolase [Acidimicrobiia bacterium]|nr:MBL fold metallo-hydrolase [Acidimicrobiia bacterium]
MRGFAAVVVAACLVVGACGSSQGTSQQVIEQAAAALGGLDRLRSLKSIAMEGEGTNGNLGQDLTPEATSQTFTITGYRRVISFSANTLRTEQTRTPGFLYFQGQEPQKQVMGVDGDIGYNTSPLGAAVRMSEAVTRQRRVEMLHHPVSAVRAALDPGARLAPARSEGQETAIDVTTASGVAITLAIDATTHLPTRVSSPSYDPNLGDVTVETQFSDYRDVSGTKLPAHIIAKTDRFVTADLRMTNLEVDGVVGDMAAPEDAVASRPAPSVPQPVLDDMEIAPGVWLIAGQSHHSAVVELPEELLLIEAPQHEARTLAVIRRARELRPGKPLKRVVNTHHHFDHAAGLRAAVAEGLAVVTHVGNEAFVKEIVARAHSRHPDTLARQPRPLTVETVSDAHDLAGDVRLFHVAGSPHSSTMLMAYVPKHRLLIEADAFTPNALAPFATNLLENVERRGLVVDHVVPLHGSVVPFEELRRAVHR